MRALSVTLSVVALVGAAACGGAESTLPYSSVQYDSADARRAFVAEGFALVTRSRGVITTLGDRHDALEVDVFGEPDKVRAAGFSDLNHGPACTSGNRVALRWVGNVRAVVNCDLVHAGERRYVARVARALARLRNGA